MTNQQLSTNTFTVAKWVVSADPTQGTHTTIGAAVAAASANDTIFIREGTYTENLVIGISLSLVAFSAENVTILGKITFSAAAILSIYEIQLQTNSDYCISNTVNLAGVRLHNCIIDALNNTALNLTSTGNILCYNCSGNENSTEILFTASNGAILFRDCSFNSNGAGTSTVSGGCNLYLRNTRIWFPISIANSPASIFYCRFGSDFSPFINATFLTLSGTASADIFYCSFYSGTAACISVGSGSTINIANPILNSSAANAITGAGTMNYGNIIFTGTSVTTNVTTEVAYTHKP